MHLQVSNNTRHTGDGTVCSLPRMLMATTRISPFLNCACSDWNPFVSSSLLLLFLQTNPGWIKTVLAVIMNFTTQIINIMEHCKASFSTSSHLCTSCTMIKLMSSITSGRPACTILWWLPGWFSDLYFNTTVCASLLRALQSVINLIL